MDMKNVILCLKLLVTFLSQKAIKQVKWLLNINEFQDEWFGHNNLTSHQYIWSSSHSFWESWKEDHSWKILFFFWVYFLIAINHCHVSCYIMISKQSFATRLFVFSSQMSYNKRWCHLLHHRLSVHHWIWSKVDRFSKWKGSQAN